MSEMFVYNTTREEEASMTHPAPLFPDFDPNSPLAKELIQVKKDNDETFWPRMRKIFEHDLNTLPMERFKVWASVWTVPFNSRLRWTNFVKATLSKIDDPLYAEALKEPLIGYTENDFRQLFSVFDDFPTTSNRIQAMAHLVICDYTAEQLSKMDTIIEFGGGIGDLADIIQKLGFKGKYILYDLPEVGRIQKYYHDRIGHKNILHTSNLDDLCNADLCIGTWSFTEMPIDLRNQIMERVGGTKNWLLAYSNDIFKIDNNKYITEEFVPRFKNHDIEYIDLPFIQWHGGEKYLIVKSRD